MAYSVLLRNCLPKKISNYQAYLLPVNSIFKANSIGALKNNFPKSFWTRKVKKSERIRLSDGISKDFEIVYRSPTTSLVNGCQLAGLIVCACYVIVLFSPVSEDTENSWLFGPKTAVQRGIAHACLFLFLGSVTYVSLKMPLRIYAKDNTFILIKNGLFGPFNKSKIEFKAGQCLISRPSMFSVWNDSRYNVNGKDLYIFDDFFRTNADYHRMMSSM